MKASESLSNMDSFNESVEKLDTSSYQFKEVLFRLQLVKVKIEDWIILQRSRFDISVSGEPYSALQMYIHSKSGGYLIRVWGKTHSKGKMIKSLTDFESLCNQIFGEGLACCPGLTGLGSTESLVSVDYPFERWVSRACDVLHPSQRIYKKKMRIDICSQCASDKKVQSDTRC